jgi:small-conductance mechanosensitive channel
MDAMFKALQAKATELQQKTMAFHSQQQQLTGADGRLTQQKSSTLQQLTELQSQQSRLNKLMTEGDTLSATIHDNTLQMNAAYMRYFVWLGAAITLGLVAMHKASK